MLDEKTERIMIILLIALGIFVAGVQIGIHHGRELQKQEFHDYICTD